MTEPITVVLPLRIVSVANLRECWQAKAKRTGRHRVTAATLVGQAIRGQDTEGRIVVTLTRIAPRALDTDNAVSGLKACRDGVADALRIDDADPRLTWAYAQRKGKPNEYAAEVRIEVRD